MAFLISVFFIVKMAVSDLHEGLCRKVVRNSNQNPTHAPVPKISVSRLKTGGKDST